LPSGAAGPVWAYFNALHKAAGQRVHESYESDCEYLAILVVENAGVDEKASVPQTCLLADAIKGPAWVEARKAWKRVRKASVKFGVELPAGEPLLIVDYH